ncbi:Retrovirus-related Pol polyprotein from transposon TNT 1-94 [Senna tora]|uniref:Retrovirus-related Pol polyprotein from transposon TNT 1-94 n=1 Tax=Senna tora TaxID=362788 RepID=A0A835CHV0_9FABA|nr:Retrovirus-related Pol polyprotein from transposon TNT 1-94 [Senna tora]
MDRTKTPCQVCGKPEHLAVNCYHRYDQSYTEATLQQAMHSQQLRPSYPNGNNTPMEAMIATPKTLFDANWYPNSGASNHITNTASNLHNKQQYEGSVKVFEGTTPTTTPSTLIPQSSAQPSNDAPNPVNQAAAPSSFPVIDPINTPPPSNEPSTTLNAHPMTTHAKGTSTSEIKALVKQLHQVFALKDLGKLHYFLGIEINYLHDGSMLLTQSKYLKDLL